ALLVLFSVIAAARTPLPDVLVADDGRTFAVRGVDGRLSFHHTGGDTFAIREWLAADADGRDIHDPGLDDDISCDPSGCIGRLADGSLVAYTLAPDAFEDDCRNAALIVAMHDPPPGCAAMVIGRADLRTRGALALRRTGSGFVIDSARPLNFDRPWAPAPAPPKVQPGNGAPVPDATPRPEDLDAPTSRPRQAA
ncbi:MAG: competence protein ComEC, partial [Xanthobacteraceae bacterium]